MRGLDALLTAYPGRLTRASAQQWLEGRRALLVARTAPAGVAGSVGSACAAAGAHTHALALAADAEHALARLDAGLGTARCPPASRAAPATRAGAR